MIAFLSGKWSAHIEHYARQRRDLGVMRNPDSGNVVADDVLQALENGCFSKGDRFDAMPWLDWLDTCPRSALFATVPDVLGDAAATYQRFMHYQGLVEDLGHKRAFVLQNGATDDLIPWHLFQCLFVGGDDLFKLGWTARHYVAEANARGLWTHMGRVNSWRRMADAVKAGYDSVDGTYLAFGPDKNLPRVLGWLDSANSQSGVVA